MGSDYGVCMGNFRIVRKAYGAAVWAEQETLQILFFFSPQKCIFLPKGRDHLAKSSACTSNILPSPMSMISFVAFSSSFISVSLIPSVMLAAFLAGML